MDWGAILLVDERFVQKANPNCVDSKKISKWVREQLIVYNNFDTLSSALEKFVNLRAGNTGGNSEAPLNIQKELTTIPEID